MNDIFDKIISGDIPSTKIYEDEFVYSFLDINPKRKGHTLVIPKKCINTIEEMNNDEIGLFFVGLKNTISVLKEQYDFEQYNVVQNCGELAGQEVFHLHYHIVPAYK